MTERLRLDLSASRAKVLRARQHLDELYGQIDRLFESQHPYSVRWGAIDQDGWVPLYLTLHNVAGTHLGVIVGDVMHNLRSALDYIVAQLTLASGAALRRQQFPIYALRSSYVRDQGTPDHPKKAHAIQGVACGLTDIEAVQPYHLTDGGGDPHADPLWHVHRFSNADKHREIAAQMFPIDKVHLRASYVGGQVTDEWQERKSPPWSPGSEYEFRRVRFAPPFPTEIVQEGEIALSVVFAISPLSDETQPHGIGTEVLVDCCTRVSGIIDRFESL